MIHSRPLLLAALLLVVSGCYTGKKKPLFGGEDTPTGPRLGGRPTAGEPVAGAGAADGPGAALPLRTAPVDQLLRRLRRAGVGAPKRAVIEELLRRGPSAKPLVRSALDEERVLLDLLLELARRLDLKPRPQSGGRVRAPWVQAKYRMALDRYAAGDLYGSLRLIDAIFALEPDTTFSAKLRRLRRRSTDRLMRDGLLRAEIEFSGAGCLETKANLKVRVRLTNVSRERIVLKVSQQRASALGVVSLDYEELSHTGTRTRLRTQHRVAAPRKKIRLGPGQALTLKLTLPSPHRKLAPGLVGRYHVSGWLRAQSMIVGDTTYPGFIPLLSRRRLAVGPADLHVTKAPVERFKAEVAAAQKGALRQRREPARRAFVAAVVWGQADREAALKGLIKALDKASRPPLSDSLCAALGRVSGEPLSFTRHEWLMWWAERESRPRRDERDE